MKVFPKNVLYHGSLEPPRERVALRAGPVTLFYMDGDLRYLRLGQREIIRRIYVAVRDRNWGTVPAELTNLDLVRRPDSFRIFYEAVHVQGEINFIWKAEIIGEPSGRIVFTMDGEARSTFFKNRIGICVLHPIRECAGTPCRVVRVDGSSTATEFPHRVVAEQPVHGITNVAGFAHEDVPGCWIEVKFSGAVFEMEDQRNWIDASFKTYSPPLRLPYPVQVVAGQHIPQQVAIEISGPRSNAVGAEATTRTEIEFHPSSARPLPPLGLGASSFSEPLSALAIERLRQLRLTHLRIDAPLSNPQWKAAFARAWTDAKALGVQLEVAVFIPAAGNVVWPEVRRLFQAAKGNVARFLVFSEDEKVTSQRALGLARQHLGDFRAPIGIGTNADFYQLNQERPRHELADFIAWSMNPQVHAFDLASLAETPEAIPAQIESAREYFGDKPIVISPVTLKPRFNPVATGPEPPVPTGELPPQVDPRQMSLFGAAWTLAAYKYLAESKSDSVTFYETVGWRGIMETEDGPALPEKFRSVASGIFPMFHFLADLGEFAEGELLVATSTQPLAVNAIVLRKGDRTTVLLANLSEQKQAVRVSGLSGAASARMLDERTADLAMRDPDGFRERWRKAGLELELSPFAYCRLDLNENGG